jgi:hypothetical protein
MFVLLAWSGGVALAAAVVTLAGIVGQGFTWLAAGTAVLVGVWPALAGRGVAAWVAAGACAVGGLVVTLDRRLAGVALGVGSVASLVAASAMASPVLAASATAALGGITGEMLLGHWYLVDPTLPRAALRWLALAGVVGVLVDGGLVLALVGAPDDVFLTGVAAVLTLTTAVLMVAVMGALRHPAYSGVMAATGLSYLAVLTGLASVFIARVLAVGGGPVLS